MDSVTMSEEQLLGYAYALEKQALGLAEQIGVLITTLQDRSESKVLLPRRENECQHDEAHREYLTRPGQQPVQYNCKACNSIQVEEQRGDL